MSEPLTIPFVSKNGIRGTVKMASRLLDDNPEKSVTFETGRQALVGAEHLHLKQDGTYYLDLNVDPRPPDPMHPESREATLEVLKQRSDDVVIPVAQEQLVVGKRLRETGRVRVTKTAVAESQAYDASVVYEDYVVERVPIGREVSEMTTTRIEGDVTIVPVYEEEVITIKRLILREEIRLTKKRREEHRPGTISLRKQQVNIERLGPKQ